MKLNFERTFKNSEEVAAFRKEIKEKTEKRFKEIDKQRRLTAIKARQVRLD